MKQKIVSNAGAGMLERERNPIVSKVATTGIFLRELIRFPREIGAVLPSSRNLSKAMAKWLPMNSNEYVLELGPGTGVVTEALFEHGLREDRLVAIEQSPRMADLLRARFPRATIITGDAFQLDVLLKEKASHVETVGAVVSSLPLLNFKPAIADGLARKIHSLLPPKGRLVQYSYKIRGLQPKAAEHFQLVASKRVWLNLPPALVSVYQK